MLISAVIRLRAEGSGRWHDIGRAAQAWFLEQVQEVAPILASALHQGDEQRPYTVALLAERRSPREPWLHLTALTESLAEVLREHILPALPERLTLADWQFQVVDATMDGADHLWAGQTTYEALTQRHLMGSQEPSPRLNLEFATPTTFHSRGRHLPLPLPSLAFDSWLRRWNAFAPLRLPEEAARFAEEDLAISRHRLHTGVVRSGPAPIVGFLGRCDYRFIRRDAYRMRLLHLLAAYAFYCGTGHKTTMGLGQTRVIGRRSSVRSPQSSVNGD